MAYVYYSKVIDAPADKVWSIVRDFGALPVWFPFVESSTLHDGESDQVGVIRSNTVRGGNVIDEKLLELSDRDRRIVYAVVDGDVPTQNYSAVLSIHEVTEDNRAFAAWSATFDVDGDITPVAEWVRSGIFETCLKQLEQVVVNEKNN